jgi:hypothetical protein
MRLNHAKKYIESSKKRADIESRIKEEFNLDFVENRKAERIPRNWGLLIAVIRLTSR